MACGAGVCLFFGFGVSVTELLLRRFAVPFFRRDVFAMWRVFRRNADAAANATLFCILVGRAGTLRSRSGKMGPKWDGGAVDESPQLYTWELIDRLVTCVPTLEAPHPTDRVLHIGARCNPRPSSPTEHLTAAPNANPAFLVIIFAATTWSKPAPVAMQTLWGAVGACGCRSGKDERLGTSLRFWLH